ncbi:MAG: hypothetical protein QXU58_04675 [Pyrobaculum sp.]
MRWIFLTMLLTMLLLASVIKVVDNLGFPIQGAAVCTPTMCVYTNATGEAVVLDAPVEIYIEGLLVWRSSTVDNFTTVVLYKIDQLEIVPLSASGELILKFVKTINNTYSDIKFKFFNNKIEKPLYIGINYPVEIYIQKIGRYIFNTTIKTQLWSLEVDLTKLGLVAACRYTYTEPVARVSIVTNGSVADSSSGWFYLIKGVEYIGLASTNAVLPNGSRYIVSFNPVAVCNKTIDINSSRVVISLEDSFGVVRNDWTLRVADNTYRGVAEFWAVVGYSYDVYIDAGFVKKNISITPRRATEKIIINVENAYLVLNYRAPVSKIYVVGNYTVVDKSPRRIELPPGLYQVVIEAGGRNRTYIVELRPGEIIRLTVGEEEGGGTSSATYAFVAVVATIISVVSALAITETLRRRRLRRGQSRS